MSATTDHSQSLDNNNNDDDREKMKDYWKKHSKDCSIQEMMLDTNAEIISDKELPEILSVLPSYTDKSILELGAGIGRFTKVLAEKARKVIAVDFIKNFIEKNQELNEQMGNIEFVHGDATKLAYEPDQFDMIFTNWLLMYLTDAEIADLVEKSLDCLKDDGYFFIRESCFHPSGNIKNIDGKNENPTKYRSPAEYIDLYLSRKIRRGESDYGFELVFARPNLTYINMKDNSNQTCFLFHKVKLENYNGYKTLKEFFDEQQYSRDSILQYENIYGANFISPGGRESTELFFGNLDLKPGQRILDIGCGIGGAAFYLSEKYGVEVYGLDLSTNMIVIAWERLQSAKKSKDLKIRFEIGDITKHTYPDEYFDFIYSRDVFLHISNKAKLLSKVRNWLKPDGRLFVTDYTCTAEPWSDEFRKYVSGRGYNLNSVGEYEGLLKEAGFRNIEATDRTELFVEYLNSEVQKFSDLKEDFLKTFTLENYNYLFESWQVKLKRTGQGEQRWAAFSAQK